MRIRGKIAFGYLILILLLLFVQLYQLALANRMLTAIQQMSGVDFRAGQASIVVDQALDVLKEFVEKYVLTRDPRYLSADSGIEARMRDLDSHIEDLEILNLDPGMEQELQLLKERWAALSKVVESMMAASVDDPNNSDPETLVPQFQHEFEVIKRHTGRIISETSEEVQAGVPLLEGLSRQARHFSTLVVGVGLGASLFLSFLVVRSVSKPLSQLTRGARRLAKGDFAVLVDESGRDELAELAANFNVMVRQLRELDQLKSDFVSHVSHELKAPLASMQETTRLLMDQIPGGLNQKQQRLLQLNLACGERLSGMIKNLLDLSTIDAGAMKYQFELTDLAVTVQRAVEEFEGLAGEKDLTLEVELPEQPPIIPCDEERCLQVLGNLISNAVKFSSRGAPVTVGVECFETPPRSIPEAERHRLMGRYNRFCVLFVRDCGQGVPDELKERIFERFFVLAGDRKNPGEGTGLGLAISRKISEAHDGLLWVEDNPGGGSVFFFLLPDRGR